MPSPRPFSRYEFLIAWRYLRARRAEGGVSTMTWISLIGIALGVAALIVTLAVRTGFREEFVDTILGANAHVAVSMSPTSFTNELTGEVYMTPGRVTDYDAMAARLAAVPGVTRSAPVVRGQVMATAEGRSNSGGRLAWMTSVVSSSRPTCSKGQYSGHARTSPVSGSTSRSSAPGTSRRSAPRESVQATTREAWP